MAFAMNPDDGLPRLFRYVERGVLDIGLRATLDVASNLLVIDREWFDQLTATEQNLVLRTQRPYIDTESRIAA